MFAGVKPQSSSLVLLLGGVVLGCSNWLGLDDLSFQAAPGSGGNAASGTGGAVGIDTDDLIPDEKPQLTPEEEQEIVSDSFPSTWPEETLFAVEPTTWPDPYYFAYEPSQHRLTVLRLVEGEDRVATATWAGDQTWNQLVAVSSSTGPVLVGYDGRHGIVERAYGFKPDGSFEVTRSSGNQHTHLIRWDLDSAGAQVLFGYDGDTGFYRGVPATSEDDAPVIQGTIAAGWSSVVGVRFEDEPALLFYSSESGDFALYGLAQQGLEQVSAGNWLSGLGVFTWPGQSNWALYDASLGKVDWVVVFDTEVGMGGSEGEGAGSLATQWESTWYLRRNLNWIDPLHTAWGGAVLSFDGEVLDFVFVETDQNIIR